MRGRFTASDGTSLAFRDEGEGPVLLALAGLTRDGRDFDYLARHLTGVRLLRLCGSFPVFGLSLEWANLT